MTERSAQPTAAPQTTPSVGASSVAAPAKDSSGTAVRPGFAERLQAKLSSANDEHKAGADVEPTPPVKQRGRSPRRARLRLTRIDPWSVMKASFLLSIAFGIVTVVAVAMIWQVLGAAGVWDSINQSVQGFDSGSTNNFDIQNYVGTNRVLGFTMLVAAVDVVLLTAISTLGAFLYNMSAALLGGVEVTLAED